jgi:dihydrolipoamide dehydrogenase
MFGVDPHERWCSRATVQVFVAEADRKVSACAVQIHRYRAGTVRQVLHRQYACTVGCGRDSFYVVHRARAVKRMLILGGGIIGLEMGTVYSTLGARLDMVEMLDGLVQGADRDLVKVWQKMNAKRFDNIMLKTKTVGARSTPEGIEVTFESAESGSKAPEPQVCDLVLQAVGRSPNGKKIGAENAGVAVTDRGFINVDIQMRTNVPHIFAIGDIVGQPMLAHKAVHKAHVAAEVITGELQGNAELAASAFNARVIPNVAHTDP